MQISTEPKEWRVTVALDSEAEEASFVYDLVQSERLELESKETLPLPFRGQFLIKVPQRPRPVPVQVARMEATATETIAGKPPLRLLIACPPGSPELIEELATTLREVPPVSAEEFRTNEADRDDEHTRVRRMTFAQRVIYATRAGQSGRTVILQQPSAMLLLYLCKNPLITLPEVVQIAKMPSIDSLVAEYIVRMIRTKPQWALSEELKIAVVTNVKTPGGTALSLLNHLSSKGLRLIARKDVNSQLKNGALKILMDRKA